MRTRLAFTRLALTALVVLTMPLLAACGSPTAVVASDPPAVVALPDVTGQWIATRTLMSTTVTNEGVAVGAVDTRSITLSDVTCDAAMCTGTFTSGASFSEADQAVAPAQFTFDGTTLSVVLDTQTYDCKNTDGSVGIAQANMIDSAYTLTVSDGDDNAIAAFEGSLDSTLTSIPAAAGTMCDAEGDRNFTVSMVRAES